MTTESSNVHSSSKWKRLALSGSRLRLALNTRKLKEEKNFKNHSFYSLSKEQWRQLTSLSRTRPVLLR